MDNKHEMTRMPSSGLSRRDFVKYVLAGSTLSVAALDKLNASVYQSITSLNQKFIEDESPDGIYWNAVRKHFMFEDDVVMMNNGTVGPMPKPVFNTLIKIFEVQAKNPVDTYSYIPRLTEAVRPKVAQFIGADTDEVAIIRNTTEGMNFVANGLDMKEGDEVLLSSMEHPGGTHPWKLKEKRYGIKIKEVPIGLPPKNIGEIVDAFEKAIGPRTRIISISHTVYISGLIVPLKELCKMAHEKGILVVADSAHGFGMLDLDMHDMDIDFFCTSPYKWGGSSAGVGVFYVKKDVQDKLWPTIASGGWDTHKTAKRFETLSQRADGLTIALGEAIDFQSRIGKARIERRIKSLAGHLKQGLKKIPGVKLHTSEDLYLSAGLTAFSMKGTDPAHIVDYIRQKYNIVIRTIGSDQKGTRGVRVSTHYYVNHGEIDQFLKGIQELAQQQT